MNANLGLEGLIRRQSAALYTDEYEIKVRRLFPWTDAVNTKRMMTEFGCMFVCLSPNQSVAAHSHNEEETFIVTLGSAILIVEGQSTTIGVGDVAYIPRGATHSLENFSPLESFQMLDVYWDENGKSDASINFENF